jgi:hypothetical protein
MYEQEEYDENRWGTLRRREGDNQDDRSKKMGRRKTEKERARKNKGRGRKRVLVSGRRMTGRQRQKVEEVAE